MADQDSNSTTAQADTTPAADTSATAAPIPDVDPAELKEDSYEHFGGLHIDEIKDKSLSPDTQAGHTNTSAVSGWPEWFSTLQGLLLRRLGWDEEDEKAQGLLAAYVAARAAAGRSTGASANAGDPPPKAPANVVALAAYTGRSERTMATSSAAGYKSVSSLGAGQGYNWCQAASTQAVLDGLAAMGLRFQGGNPSQAYVNWVNHKSDGKLDHMVGGRATFTDEPLAPGDVFSMVTDQSPPSGHVGTVIDVDGEIIRHVSGNAGGGAVRVSEVRRAAPPDGFSYGKYPDSEPKVPGTTNPNPGDDVWVVSIQKTARLFEQLERLGQLPADSAEYQSILSDNGLEAIPPA